MMEELLRLTDEPAVATKKLLQTTKMAFLLTWCGQQGELADSSVAESGDVGLVGHRAKRQRF
jgi:hypothetical protein